MDENQQLCSTRVRKTFPVQEVEGGEVRAESFIALVQMNHLLL